MTRPPNPLIAQLAGELEPVRPLRMAHGLALVALATTLTIAAVAWWQGLWSGPAEGQAAAIFFIANGLIALVGLASARTVVRMATPRVGARQDGSRWLLAALAILPVTALLLAALEGRFAGHDHAADGLHCFLAGTGSGVAVAAALVLWLRRGAPVAPNPAGFYTGVAAGALGSFAYGLSCPFDTIGAFRYLARRAGGAAGGAGATGGAAAYPVVKGARFVPRRGQVGETI